MGMSGKTPPSEIPSAFSSPVEKVFSSTIKRKQKTPSDKPKNISESTAYVMKMLGNVVRKGKLKLINQSKSYLIMTDDNCVRRFPDNTPVIFLQRCLFFSFRDPQCRNKARLHQGESLHCRPCYITEKMAAGIERRGRKRKKQYHIFPKRRVTSGVALHNLALEMFTWCWSTDMLLPQSVYHQCDVSFLPRALLLPTMFDEFLCRLCENAWKMCRRSAVHFLFKAHDNFGSPLISEGFIVFGTRRLKQEHGASGGEGETKRPSVIQQVCNKESLYKWLHELIAGNKRRK